MVCQNPLLSVCGFAATFAESLQLSGLANKLLAEAVPRRHLANRRGTASATNQLERPESFSARVSISDSPCMVSFLTY